MIDTCIDRYGMRWCAIRMFSLDCFFSTFRLPGYWWQGMFTSHKSWLISHVFERMINYPAHYETKCRCREFFVSYFLPDRNNVAILVFSGWNSQVEVENGSHTTTSLQQAQSRKADDCNSHMALVECRVNWWRSCCLLVFEGQRSKMRRHYDNVIEQCSDPMLLLRGQFL